MARAIGDLVLDTVSTDLTGNEAVLASPDWLRRTTIWWDASHRWLMVFTGDTPRARPPAPGPGGGADDLPA